MLVYIIAAVGNVAAASVNTRKHYTRIVRVIIKRHTSFAATACGWQRSLYLRFT